MAPMAMDGLGEPGAGRPLAVGVAFSADNECVTRAALSVSFRYVLRWVNGLGSIVVIR